MSVTRAWRFGVAVVVAVVAATACLGPRDASADATRPDNDPPGDEGEEGEGEEGEGEGEEGEGEGDAGEGEGDAGEGEGEEGEGEAGEGEGEGEGEAGEPCGAVRETDLQALDLTLVRHVRAVYFTPRDRPFRECLNERLNRFANIAQDFYRSEMELYGYTGPDGGGKTFLLDADADGWRVVYLVGEQDAAFYQEQADAPGAAMAEMFRRLPAAFHENNVTLYLYDTAVVDAAARAILFSGNGGSGAPWEGDGAGYVLQGTHFLGLGFDTIALDPAAQAALFEDEADAGVDDYDGTQAFGPVTRGEYASTYLGAALHELGHAFYLDHVFTDYDGDGVETNLMGNGFRRLSGRYSPRGYQPATGLGPDHAAQLNDALLFNVDGD